ncbi:MAG TPA: glycosyltransferase family 4 protein [Puia sp.]|nr:glycosyltransferase family 4 protein [Puia sp.]
MIITEKKYQKTVRSVLITAYACCPDTGSESGNGWSWIINYLRNGYKVYCVTSSIYKKELQQYFLNNKHDDLKLIYADNFFALKTFQIPVLGNYIHYYLWILNAKKIIRSELSGIDFFHAHHITYSSIKFGTPLYDINFKLIIGPVGGSRLPHRSLKKYLGRYYYFEWFKNFMSYVLAKCNPAVARSVKKADIILTSNEIADELINKYSSKKTIRMFDAGLADYFELPLTKKNLDGKINILWVGTMFPRKGLNLAIEAISFLPANFNFHFTIAGNGQCKKNVVALTEKLGLRNKVTFLDHISHKEIMERMKESHVLLFPTLIDSCPTQLFEAFALGLPVVTLDHQGMKDQVIEGAGIKVAVGDKINYPAELAKAIMEIVKDDATYKQYVTNAYRYGQQQLWKKRIRDLLNELNISEKINSPEFADPYAQILQ